MRRAITVGRPHGKEEFELIAGPDVGLEKHNAAMREFLSLGGVHKEYAEVQVWDSDGGMARTIRFQSPKEAKAQAKAQAKVEQKAADKREEAAAAEAGGAEPEKPAEKEKADKHDKKDKHASKNRHE